MTRQTRRTSAARRGLTVVTGPPCSGKSHHVAKHRRPGDVVVDLDQLAQALGYPDAHVTWDSDHPAVAAARMARGHVIYSLLNGRLVAPAWIVDADPDGGMRAQYQRAGAQLITIDPGRDVCLERAADRPDGTLERIEHWYARHAGNSSATALDIFG